MAVIAVIDDEERWLDRFRKLLQDAAQTRVATAQNRDELLAAIESDDVRVILFDQDLGGTRGSDLVAEIRERHNGDRFLLGVTSSTDEADVDRFREAGADGMASKAALRHGLAAAIATLDNGYQLTPDQARLFVVPNGFIADWLVEPE